MMVYACYHAKLELAYMMDQSASLPPEKYPRDKSVLLKYDSSELGSAGIDNSYHLVPYIKVP